MKLGLMWRAIQCARAGRMGDAAALKGASTGGKAYPGVREKLSRLATPFPVIELDSLRRLPEGTFGREYARFMDDEGLMPFVVSREIAEELASTSCLEVRYPLLHDAFHVLLGFDASLVGEMGVWAFVSAQHYSPAFDFGARLGRWLYPLVIPRQRAALRAASARGEALARQARCLIAEPLEDLFALPLKDARARLGVEG
ncbi:Coq4 family protein [Melittangium boletus]|uniref:Coq4 family protein n=1 Tax=Melittangium boletus TaxID=83453 RepID=UPI003DA4C0C8